MEISRGTARYQRPHSGTSAPFPYTGAGALLHTDKGAGAMAEKVSVALQDNSDHADMRA